jgi:hypothetical protein
MKRNYGWIPDMPDQRDHMYRMGKPTPAILQSPDLTVTRKMPAVRDQDQLGACTGFGIGALMTYLVLNGFFLRKPMISLPFSPLFIYYIERWIENTIPWDSGAYIRDGIKAVANYGACSEAAWPYIISRFTEKPRQAAFRSALDYQAIEYQRLDNTYKPMLVDALVHGYPIVHGFSVYESFESNQVALTGQAPLPTLMEMLLGGHCTLTVAYDASTDRFKDLNSWSPYWGAKGYFTTPASYWTNPNLADDFWIIKVVE